MRRALLIGIFGFAVLFPALAQAQMTGNVDKLKADLYGDNLDRAVAAASALGSLKNQAALDALMASLQLGTPPKVTSAVLESIELHKDPSSVELLEQYAEHRNQEIRGGAIKALGAIEDKKVVPILINSLGDSNPMVRARAARVLGERKERVAERALFMMLRRGDVSAAKPLGVVAGVETARHLGELIGELPDGALATALGTMLLRPEFGPDTLRTEIVKALGRIPGETSTAALAEYVASVPPKELRMSKNKAKQLLEERKQ